MLVISPTSGPNGVAPLNCGDTTPGARASYRTRWVDLAEGEQMSPELLATSPNHTLPAIVDDDGPGGESATVFESGAVLVHLADEAKKRLPERGAARYTVAYRRRRQSAPSTFISAIDIEEPFLGKARERSPAMPAKAADAQRQPETPASWNVTPERSVPTSRPPAFAM